MAVEVRRGTLEDAAAIAEFAISLFEQHHDYDAERFAAMSNREGATWFYGGRTEATDVAILIAEDNGKAVGFAYLQFEAVNYADLLQSVAWLHDFYVSEDARGKGAGKALLDASVRAATELGADKIVLHVAAKNAVGQHFFENGGFRTTMHEMMLKLPADGSNGR